jgi:hypothetical protein
LVAPSDEQFYAMHTFCKEKRRSPRGCFECGDTINFITEHPKRKNLDSSNKYNYIKRNDYSKGNDKRRHHFGYKKKKKKFRKIMS